MITSYEVGAVFRIIDQASPALRKMLQEARAIAKAIADVRASLLGLNRDVAGIGFGKAIDESRVLTRQMRALARANERVRASTAGPGTSLVPAGMSAAIVETQQLANAWREVAAASAAANRDITRASRPRIAAASAAAAGGGGAEGPPRRPGGRLGSLGRGEITGGPQTSIPGGGDVRFHGAAAIGAGLIGYGAYEDAQMEDAVFQLIYHAGLPQNATNRQRFRKLLQDSMAESGYGLHDLAEAAKQETRMFQGTRGGGLEVLPEMLRASTIEARLKGESPEESMRALIGLAHMTKQYSPEEIKKLAPAFAFLSTANPGSLGSIEKAAGYAVPILQSGLGIDPVESLLLGTALTRAGATNSKSGTWLREMAMRAMPGTSLMSKNAFKKHEEALRAFGLVDDKGVPTWFTGGKPDLFKMMDIAGSRAEAIPMDKRASYERALFGAQGSGAFALLSDKAVHEQVQRLRAEMNSDEFKNRYSSFSDAYKEGSPLQQGRVALAEFNMTMMDLGRTVLPGVTGALKDFSDVLKTIRSFLPGADKDGKPDNKWKVGTRAIEGAALGAAAGTFLPGVGTLAGAAAGALAGTVGGLIEGLAKHSSEAEPQVDRFGRSVVVTGNAASSSEPALKSLADTIRGLAGAAHGGVFPGGTQKMNFLGNPTARPTVIHTALHLDGRVVAESTSRHLADAHTFPTAAPFYDGRRMWAPPDMQKITT